MRRGRHSLLPAALAALAILAAGCGAPEDDTLLRFLGFQAAGEAAGTGSVSVIQGDLRDGAPLKVDASFENQSRILGPGGGGTGITIYRLDIDYRLTGSDPPSLSLPVSLYAPPAASGVLEAGGGGTVVLSDIPIVPVSVKQWLIDNTSSERDGFLEVSVKVDFRARTDQGGELTVGGALAVTLSDEGGDGGGTTEPVLTLEASTPNALESPLTNGRFRVHRIGSTTGSLTVSYDVGGSATPGAAAGSGADYRTLSGTLVISSGSASATIDVIPFADAATEAAETVVVTLGAGAGYTVGEPNSAIVTITDD